MRSESAGPDFLGIGAQRSGSSWLHRNLSRHRDLWLFPVPLKEIHFFNELHVPGDQHRDVERNENFDRWAQRMQANGRATPQRLAAIEKLKTSPRDDDWYRELFRFAPEGKLSGEITPAYSTLPSAGIEHILRINPQMKLILMLRHPVDRAWSNTQLGIFGQERSPRDPSTAEVSLEGLRALTFDPSNRARTDYPSILRRYTSLLPPAQLCVSFFDRILTRPRALLDDIAQFLDVDPNRFNEARLEPARQHNPSKKMPLPPQLREELINAYRGDVEWLMDNLPGVPSDWADWENVAVGALQPQEA